MNFYSLRPQTGTSAVAAGDSQVVRADSHRLQTAPDGKVTLVEFLDFECEACKAYFPVVEELRKAYAGKVTFVARYFPIASHFNAERAVRAVEASARQGKFEAMYQRMYESQSQWAEKQVPADEVFRGYAKALGLDIAGPASRRVFFVHWLIFQSLYVIGALCPYCMIVWAVTIPIFLYVTLHNAIPEKISGDR